MKGRAVASIALNLLAMATGVGMVVAFAFGAGFTMSIVLVVISAGALMCGDLAACSAISRGGRPRARGGWCVHRLDGRVGFHRRVDRDHLADLEREVGIGPESIVGPLVGACADGPAALQHIEETNLRVERLERLECGTQRHADCVLSDIAGHYAVASHMLGAAPRRPTLYQSGVHDKAFWAHHGQANIVLPSAWAIETLGPDGEVVNVARPWK